MPPRASLQLSDKAFSRYKEIWADEFGEHPSDEELQASAVNLLSLFKISFLLTSKQGTFPICLPHANMYTCLRAKAPFS